MKHLMLIAAAAVSLPLASAHGEALVALTVGNELVSFDSDSPETASVVSITGLSAGQRLVGIDVRPATSELFGVAVGPTTGGTDLTGTLYTLDPATGQATLGATLNQPVTGDDFTAFGVDFNPAVDLLRLVNSLGQNLRIDVTNGVTINDGDLAYATGDINETANPPEVVAAAYRNNFNPAPTETGLFDIESVVGALVRQNPANAGTLQTVDFANAFPSSDTAFDISSRGTGFVVFDGLTLATIDLDNGNVTDVGPIGTSVTFSTINGLASLEILIPEPATWSLTAMAVICGAAISRRGVGRTVIG